MLDILLVDDEPTIRLSVGDALEDAGHRVTLAADGDAAAQKLTEHRFDVVVSDIRMPGLDGLSLFRRIRERAPETDVILITAYGAVEDAVQALKEGARDYLTKPFDTGELLLRVERLAERHALTRALQDARRALAETSRESIIIGRSPPMVRLIERIETFAAADAPVLILGESGTGKELVARELHRKDPAPPARSCPCTAPPSPRPSSKPSSSATSAAPSPAPSAAATAASAPPIAAPSSSTRSPRSRSPRRPSSSACCKRASSSRSAPTPPSASTSASSRPPTATSSNASPRAPSAKTSTTASASST
ncbi:MAG: sigma-54-dependent Fis family transcriptional regulator [Myxococcales bacterium]|nr:sigma-54-dependent Fis family transcriptional regulator [Myxococcales bacterium]